MKFNVQTVKGVTEVLSLGGEVKQFQVRVRPDDLLRYGLSLPEVKRAIEANNNNAGAQFIVKNNEQYIVRSVGLAENIPDLERTVLKTVDGTPVFLSQIADVVTGGEIRFGLATADGKGEAVVGMILKLIGMNTSEVIGAVKGRMAEIIISVPAAAHPAGRGGQDVSSAGANDGLRHVRLADFQCAGATSVRS